MILMRMNGKLRCAAVALCFAALPSLVSAQESYYDNGIGSGSGAAQKRYGNDNNGGYNNNGYNDNNNNNNGYNNDDNNDNPSAQEYRRRWGISASVGTLTQQEDGGNADSRENEGNAFALTADYYLSRHFALTAGVFAEQTGMLTDYDGDGIGKRRFWMAGVQAGAKYYFLPASWVVQPYVGASAYFNVLNLGHSRGSYDFEANEYQSPRVHAEYSVQCPAVSLAPQVGIDLRLLSSVSLTFAADYRWGLYGRSSTALRYVSGPDMGKRMLFSNPMDRITLSLGLKMDFPLRPINMRKVGTTVLDLIYLWINGRK